MNPMKLLCHIVPAKRRMKNLSWQKEQWKPVQTGVVLSTMSILDLQAELLAKGHTYVLTSRFFQDRLENLFGCICMRNPTSTALKFEQALKTNGQALKTITVTQFLTIMISG